MTRLNVTGMSCGGCVKSVAKIITRTTSAEPDDVKVELEPQSAEFPDVDSETLTALLEKLEAAGFPSNVEAG